MGANFSYVRDHKERAKLQNIYSYGITILIPYAGHWILFGFGIVRGILSLVNHRLSFQTLPTGVSGVSIANAQLYLGLFLVLLSLVGAILQEVNTFYVTCYDLWSSDPNDVSSYCYTYYNYYFPAIVMLGIVEPILAVVHMVLFSISCSQLWNEAYSKALKAQHQQMQSIPLNTVPYNPNQQPILPPYDPYAQVPQFQHPQHFYPTAPMPNGQMQGQPYYPAPPQPPPQAVVNVQMTQEQWAAVQRILATSNSPPPPPPTQ